MRYNRTVMHYQSVIIACKFAMLLPMLPIIVLSKTHIKCRFQEYVSTCPRKLDYNKA